MAKRSGKVKEKKGQAAVDFEDLANEYSAVVEYPLRNPAEDQGWAVNTVRIWVGMLTFLLVVMFALIILGAALD